MKKLFYLLALVYTSLSFGQGAVTATYVKIDAPANNPTSDYVIVWNPTTKKLDYVSKSSLGGGGSQNFQQTTDIGNISTNEVIIYTNADKSMKYSKDFIEYTKRVSGVDKKTKIGFVTPTVAQRNILFPDEDGTVATKEYVQDAKDVFAYGDVDNFPDEGTEDVLYMAEETNKLYRWDAGDFAYIQVGSDSSNFVPLSGTAEGSPITGDLHLSGGINIINGSDSNYSTLTSNVGSLNTLVLSGSTYSAQYVSPGYLSQISSSGDGNASINVLGNAISYSIHDNIEDISSALSLNYLGLVFNSDNLFSHGVSGEQDYTSNITDLDYTQKKYVDDAIDAAISGVGTGTVTSVTGTAGVTVASGTTTPVIGLGNITPNSVVSSGAVSGTNLSGTNTGDNATNTTSNTYADGKVQNNLTASTTIAPSATAVNTALAAKQDALVSGTNIKTINGSTILGSGNLTTGTVTSVAASGSQGVTISGSPVTSSGTISIGLGAITPSSINTTGAATVGALSIYDGTNINFITLSPTGRTIISGTGGAVYDSDYSGGATARWITDKGYVDTGLALKAPSASPGLTGTPTAPTATAGTNTTQIATTAYALAAAAAIVQNSLAASTILAPSVTAVNTALAAKQDALTGTGLVISSGGTISYTAISGGSTSFYNGSGIFANFAAQVRASTIGSTSSTTTQIATGTRFDDAANSLQNQLNSMTTYVAKTANYTLTLTDYCVDLTTNSATFTLPTAVGNQNKQYVVKNSGSGTTLTLATTSSQTIDGTTTKTFNTQFAGCRVISDGANWKIIGTY